jgi:uncharacterized membrane protein YeaQ/YmgE (transglycosylase-associated protein family)
LPLIADKMDAAVPAGPPHPQQSPARAHTGETLMNLIIWLVIGGLLGWIASKIMRTDAQQGILLNIVVGVVGAILAGFILTPLFGDAPITAGEFDLSSIIVSFIGALILLAIVNLFRRGTIR